MQLSKDLKVSYENLLKSFIIVLLLFIPFRNFLELYIGTFVKILPDIGIAALLVGYFVLYHEKIEIKKYDLILLIYCLITFVNTCLIRRIDFKVYLFELRSMFLYYFLFFLLRQFVFDKKFKHALCSTIKGITYVLFILGFIEKITRKAWLFPAEIAESIIYEDNFARVYSMFFNPNTYGAFLVVSFFIVLYFEKNRLLFYKITVVTSLLFSMSRSSIIIFVLFTVLFTFFIDRENFINNKKRVLVELTIISILSLCIYSCSEYFTESFLISKEESKIGECTTATNEEITATEKKNSVSDDVDDNDVKTGTTVYDRIEELHSDEIIQKSKTDGRLYFLDKGFQVFRDNPLLGTGLGTYGSAASMGWKPPTYIRYGLPYGFYADNEYIKDLVETGLIGVLIFGAFLISVLLTFKRNNFLILFCIVIGWFGLFYNVFEVQIISVLLWTMLGVSVSENN